MKRKNVLKLSTIIMMLVFITGCQSIERAGKDLDSSMNGLDRIVKVYQYGQPDPIATYEGKIDLEYDESGRLKFDLDGKRYIYYNVTAEVIEK